MKRSLLIALAFAGSFAASCTVGHMVGHNHEGAATCGGVAAIPCADHQYVCVDDPADACDPTRGGADCSGICVDASEPQRCGGNSPNASSCPTGYECVDKPGSCSMAVDCEGICQLKPTQRDFCGGIAGIQCPAGKDCVDDPNDSCDPAHGGADCGGICVVIQSPDAGHQPHGNDAGVPASCGGFVANPAQCPSGYACVDDPNSCSMAVDCPGICVAVPTECGGHVANPNVCPNGFLCVDNPNNCGMAADCTGICVQRKFCGGLASIQCGTGERCIDDPSDSCDPHSGGADCGGICVPGKGADAGTTTFCGGFAGIACPGTLRCIDDPADNCDPTNGGADCGGICVP